MTRISLLLALSGFAALLGVGCAPELKQAKACEEVIDKYFSDNPIGESANFSSFADEPFKADAEGEIRQAYDVDGSCWRTSEAIARECEKRCRAFLTADCFERFGPDNTTFADTACNFPQRCATAEDCSHGQACEDTGCCAAPEDANDTCAAYVP